MNKNYNPDILNCLANLSSDEVFTSPELANKMLDLLPQELFSSVETRFLDPCCKSGVFLREITKRLLKGIEDKIPDLQQRIDYIMKRQVYGIALTELTAQMSRRTLYCSKYANGEYSVTTAFDNEAGNIKFEHVHHKWNNGKCEFCGASRSEYARGEIKENYAYQFIHTLEPKDIFKMKFDVIIGNPPYQLSDGSGGSTDSAIPIYNKFIEQAKKLEPRYLSMIIPSKWMMGGRGLKTFRNNMMEDKRIKYLVDYEDSSDCFAGLHIDGGICYFLWDNSYCGETNYTYISNDGEVLNSINSLKNKYFKYVVRDPRIRSLLDKTYSGNSFSNVVSNVRPYGIRGYLFNEPERYPNSNLQFECFKNSIKMYGVKGIKGGAKRIEGYVSNDFITVNRESLDKYKIFFTTSYSTNAINPPEPIMGNPNTACTETFL